MGADMLAKVMWADTAPTVEKAMAAVRERLPELDRETLDVAASFAGVELGEFEAAIVGDDPGMLDAYREKIAAGYETQVSAFIATLQWRSVTTLTVGPLTGYLTGGLTYSDDPTSAWSEWDAFFADDDEGWRDDWNPCSQAIWSALFISPHQDWALPGERYVSSLTLDVKQAVTVEEAFGPAPAADVPAEAAA